MGSRASWWNPGASRMGPGRWQEVSPGDRDPRDRPDPWRSALLGLGLGEGGVEPSTRGRETHLDLDECGGLGGPVFAVHPGVLPLDGEGALVTDRVQGPGDLLE